MPGIKQRVARYEEPSVFGALWWKTPVKWVVSDLASWKLNFTYSLERESEDAFPVVSVAHRRWEDSFSTFSTFHVFLLVCLLFPPHSLLAPRAPFSDTLLAMIITDEHSGTVGQTFGIFPCAVSTDLHSIFPNREEVITVISLVAVGVPFSWRLVYNSVWLLISNALQMCPECTARAHICAQHRRRQNYRKSYDGRMNSGSEQGGDWSGSKRD